jgi:hypothetical protein
MPLTQVPSAAPAAKAFAKAGFNPDEPRDDHGRWTSAGGGGAGGEDTGDGGNSVNADGANFEIPLADHSSRSIQVADSGQIMTDAAPEQTAQEEDPKEEGDPSDPLGRFEQLNTTRRATGSVPLTRQIRHLRRLWSIQAGHRPQATSII